MQYYVKWILKGLKERKKETIVCFKAEAIKATQILKNHGIEFEESYSPLDIYDLNEAVFSFDRYTLFDEKGIPREATLEEVRGLAYIFGENWDSYIDGEFLSELTVEYLKNKGIKFQEN